MSPAALRASCLRLLILFCGCYAQLPAAQAATPTPPKHAEAADDVELVDPVGVVPVAPEQMPDILEQGLGHAAWILIGHMHALWVHFPIAWGVLWWALEWCAALGLMVNGRRLARGLASLTLMSFVPALLTGLSRLQQVGQEPMAEGLGVAHRNAMYLSALCAGILWASRLRKLEARADCNRFAYPIFVTLWLGILCYGAHLGGAMVYGPEFLFSVGG